MKNGVTDDSRHQSSSIMPLHIQFPDIIAACKHVEGQTSFASDGMQDVVQRDALQVPGIRGWRR
jgi:hypothetical protein